jgi:predicted molibdopterin-dependent oxidoreductase YjgC
VRPSVPHKDSVRPLWQALAELSSRLGDETGAGAARDVFDLLAADSPLYAGQTHDTIGGTGTRPNADGGGQRAAGEGSGDTHGAGPTTSSADPDAASRRRSTEPSPAAPAEASDRLALGRYRDLWADYVAEENENLRFLSPGQTVELSLTTAKRLGFGNGSEVLITAETGASVRARVAIRPRQPDSVAFLIDGVRENGANRLGESTTVEISEAPVERELVLPVVEVAGNGGGEEGEAGEVSW